MDFAVVVVVAAAAAAAAAALGVGDVAFADAEVAAHVKRTKSKS
jgi:hypothetical protein